MHGKTVIITGATSGIGKAAACGLARLGATVVLTSRDKQRGKKAQQDIIAASGNPGVEVLDCDLASMNSIRSFCSEFINTHDSLHVLINNAGTWDFKKKLSEDGIGNVFAVNYLAPFLMTGLLLDVLKNSAPARIVNVGSGLHSGTIDFSDIECAESFLGIKTYRQSKLALILFTRILAQKLQGTGVTANAVHPGFVSTDLGREAGFFLRFFFQALGAKPEKGARTILYAASSPDVAAITGEYLANCTIGRSSQESRNMLMAEKLWKISEEYIRPQI